MAHTTNSKNRYGMVINLDRCSGCGSCMMACAVENNVPPAAPAANDRTGITPLRVYQMKNGESFPNARAVFIPLMCQQCGHDTPCVSVCPQNAVDVDPKTGVVGQMPERCLGCRYCMTACPYHARYFNWRDPVWPAGMERTLNPDVSPRMRGVVEKCNFCHGRLHAAQSKAAAAGKKEIDPADYVPACAEACPARAITFGDLNDSNSEAAQLACRGDSFRLLEKLGTEPKVYFRSWQPWVKQMAQGGFVRPGKEAKS
jgi:molybdopterin-containing oxidoreductase family iron-sulfur binding subunit